MNRKIVTFPSVHQALKAEKVLRSAGISIDAINTPRHLSKDCGISLRFAEMDEPQVVTLLSVNTVNYAGIYEYRRREDG